MTMTPRRIALSLLCLLPLALGGCLAAASSKKETSGNYVSAEAFSRIETGKTTAAYVEATLGKPDSKTTIDDGSEIWRWSYTETEKSAGYVFLIFGGANEKSTKKSAYVQVRDGVVVKAWRE